MQEERQFYIEPIGGETNKRITELLGQQVEENICQAHKCADGTPRDLIKVTARQFLQCLASKRSSKLTFNEFVDEGQGTVPLRVIIADDEPAGPVNQSEWKIKIGATIKAFRISKLAPLSFGRGVPPFNALQDPMRSRAIRKMVPTRARKP